MRHIIIAFFAMILFTACKDENTQKIDNTPIMTYDGMTVETLTRDDNYGFYSGTLKNITGKNIIISKDSKNFNVFFCLSENVDKYGYSNFVYIEKSVFNIASTDVYNGEYTDTSNSKKVVFRNFSF
jgi:ferredoxin-fold anticodon binding domain-containing protein